MMDRPSVPRQGAVTVIVNQPRVESTKSSSPAQLPPDILPRPSVAFPIGQGVEENPIDLDAWTPAPLDLLRAPGHNTLLTSSTNQRLPQDIMTVRPWDENSRENNLAPNVAASLRSQSKTLETKDIQQPEPRVAPRQKEWPGPPIIEIDDDESTVSYDSLYDQLRVPREAFFPEIAPEPGLVQVADPQIYYQYVLEIVLELFPGIKLDYVRQLFDARPEAFAHQKPSIAVEALAQGIMNEISESLPYPKQAGPNKRRRNNESKNSDDEEAAEWIDQSRPPPPQNEFMAAITALEQEFRDVPMIHIHSELRKYKYIFPAYKALEAAIVNYNENDQPFKRLKSRRKIKNTPLARFPHLEKELEAARKQANKERQKRLRLQQEAEEDALRDKMAFESGDFLECQCCFTDTPLAKAVHCDGEVPHFFCIDCAKGNAKAKLDLSQYKLHCMDGSGCKAEFSMAQRARFLDNETQKRLDKLQQQDEIRVANLDDLVQCPFCDFAALCPPLEIDKEFRCQNEECGVVSCRQCKKESHIPKTCQENRKDQGIDERHIIEEEMTKALLRPCPKCRIPIVKDGGCNKLICSRCGCYVCDVCGKDITGQGYQHFIGSACQGTDNSYARNERKIQEARDKAKARIRKENPDVTDEDLEIKFSDAVKSQGLPPMRDLFEGQPMHRRPRVRAAPLPAHGLQARAAELHRALMNQQQQQMGRVHQIQQLANRHPFLDPAHVPAFAFAPQHVLDPNRPRPAMQAPPHPFPFPPAGLFNDIQAEGLLRHQLYGEVAQEPEHVQRLFQQRAEQIDIQRQIAAQRALLMRAPQPPMQGLNPPGAGAHPLPYQRPRANNADPWLGF